MEPIKWDAENLDPDWLEKCEADIKAARARPYGNSLIEEIVKDVCIRINVSNKISKIKEFLGD